ncbi:glycoside hydrolase family 97 protein [Sphingomonas sp. RB1R13]|uniref:glycoside hydrolase family 97 protein n=1 Tax=Sphingomonas sp. RB1R13 TaxID=3096159 RepID=UPI002FC6F182
MRLSARGPVMMILAALCACSQARADVILRSPNGRAVVAIALSPTGVPQWSVSWRGKTVLDPAPIGLRFASDADPTLRLADIKRRSHDGMVTGLLGKASTARDRYREAKLTLANRAHPLRLVIRAYDDGVAYRWEFDAKETFAIADELAGFGVPPSTRVWVMPVTSFTSSYEEYYRSGALDQAAPDGSLLTLPLLMQRAGTWAGITEAALHDWSGLYLVRRDGQPGLSSRLSPRVDRSGVAVIGGAGRHRSPWRVVMLGDTPGRLIESNLVTLLNPPPDHRDWRWVETGKTSFPWWNDYFWPAQGFTPGLNTATMNAYIDFDADHGIPFHTLDGFQGQAWYEGPIEPGGKPQDITRARREIDLDEVLARARRRGVGLRLWCHWVPLKAQLDVALSQWQRWGIKGLMVDFMDRDDQEMVAFYDEVAAKAASHHLTVVYHGASKPTGANRTWPNVLAHEAVRGTEYDKFDDNPGSTPHHEATTPFTRMLAGPMDIHAGGFDSVSPAAFRNRNRAPQVMGTRAHALATYIVEENELSMVSDTPANYVGAREFGFVAQTPSTWDETRVLGGDVGQYIVVARRKGAQWWLGAITNGSARTLSVRLEMLRGQGWTLDGYADAGSTRAARRVTARLRAGQVFVMSLAEAGGFAARLTPVRLAARKFRRG